MHGWMFLGRVFMFGCRDLQPAEFANVHTSWANCVEWFIGQKIEDLFYSILDTSRKIRFM